MLFEVLTEQLHPMTTGATFYKIFTKDMVVDGVFTKFLQKCRVTLHQQLTSIKKEHFSENISIKNFLEVIKRIFIQEEE